MSLFFHRLNLISAMTKTTEVPIESQDESFLGTIDLILLAGLLVGALYWLWKRNQKEEKPAARSYSIQ